MQQQSKPLKDVRPLYKEFIQHLSKPKSHKKIAQLQPLCKLEDYLTKEFAAFIIERSHKLVRPRFNFGKRQIIVELI